jgi:hypothetical protein
MNDLDVPKGSQPPFRRRFYIGSAAIFWFFAALLIWVTLFYNLSPQLKKDGMWWGAWFIASYFSAPALLAALLAVLIRNLSANAAVPPWLPAWLITPPVFVFVGYIMLRNFFMGH